MALEVLLRVKNAGLEARGRLSIPPYRFSRWPGRLRSGRPGRPLLNPLLQKLRHVAVGVQNSDNLQRLCFRPVNNQVGVYGEKPHLGVGQVAPPMSAARKLREISQLVTDGRFHAVGGFLAALVFDETLNLYEVAGCLGR